MKFNMKRRFYHAGKHPQPPALQSTTEPGSEIEEANPEYEARQSQPSFPSMISEGDVGDDGHDPSEQSLPPGKHRSGHKSTDKSKQLQGRQRTCFRSQASLSA